MKEWTREGREWWWLLDQLWSTIYYTDSATAMLVISLRSFWLLCRFVLIDISLMYSTTALFGGRRVGFAVMTKKSALLQCCGEALLTTIASPKCQRTIPTNIMLFYKSFFFATCLRDTGGDGKKRRKKLKSYRTNFTPDLSLSLKNSTQWYQSDRR